VSDSDGEEVRLGRPKRYRTAASKIVDPSNGSSFALTSHRDAAIAAQLAAKVAKAAAAVTDDGAASGSLSAIASTSNSRSVSPGKRNAYDASLSSKSSESGETSAQDKPKGKGKQRGRSTDSVIACKLT